MGALTDVCRELEQVLHNVADGCQTFSLAIDQVNERTMEAAIALKFRLLAIGDDLLRSEKSLYLQHSGKGHVFLLMGANGGLNMHWVETKEVVADRHAIPGRTVVSVNEVLNIITDLMAKVDSGKRAEALLWLNAYGRQSFT